MTFVIVDLETTGGPATEAGITEIGAVKVRRGQTGRVRHPRRFDETSRPHSGDDGHNPSMLRDAPSVAGAVASFGSSW